MTEHAFKQGLIDRLVSGEIFTIVARQTKQEIGIQAAVNDDGQITSVQWWTDKGATHALVHSPQLTNSQWPSHLLSAIVEEIGDAEMKRMAEAIRASERRREEE